MTDAELTAWAENFVRDLENASYKEFLDAWRNRLSEEDRQYLLQHYADQILPRLNQAYREEDHDAGIVSETEQKILKPLYGVLFGAFWLAILVLFNDGCSSIGLDKVNNFFSTFGVATFCSAVCLVVYKLYKFFFR